MNICICDDDLTACEHLKNMISHHGFHTITTYHSAEELLFECENHFPFDCIFLDIQMKDMNGVECARRIRQSDEKVKIVLLSVIQDYVFEGYEVGAMRYLLKPLQQEKCHALLDLVEASLETKHHFVYVNKTKVDCEDIIYIESQGHYCYFYMKNNKTPLGGTAEAKAVLGTKTPIGELLSQLPDTFVQTHRSYVVNLSYVESIVKDGCLLSDEILIPISRNSVKKVNSAFMEYIKGGLL